MYKVQVCSARRSAKKTPKRATMSTKCSSVTPKEKVRTRGKQRNFWLSRQGDKGWSLRTSTSVKRHTNICSQLLPLPNSPSLQRKNKAGDVIERVWDTISVHERLKEHFDLMAHDLHAVSYSYEILGD